MEEEESGDSDSTVLLDDYDRKPHIVAAKRRKLAVKCSTGQTTDDAGNNSENTVPNEVNKNNSNTTSDTHFNLFWNKNDNFKHQQWHINRYFDELNRQEDIANNEDLKIKRELLKQETVCTVEDDSEEYNFENSAAKLDIANDDIITIDDSDDDCVITEILDNDGSNNNKVKNKQPFDSFSKTNDLKSRLLGINSRRVSINDFNSNDTTLDASITMCTDNEHKNKLKLIVLKPLTINARRSTIDISEIKHNRQTDTEGINPDISKTENLNLILKERAPGLNLPINEAGNVINKAIVDAVSNSHEKSSLGKIPSTICSEHSKEDIIPDMVTLNKNARENISESELALLHNDLVDQQNINQVKSKASENDWMNQLNSNAPPVNAGENKSDGVENHCNINTELTVALADSGSTDQNQNLENKDRTDEVVNVYVNAKEVSRKRISIDITTSTIKRARTCKETIVKNPCYQSGKIQKINTTDTNHVKDKNVGTRITNVGKVVEQKEISSNIANNEGSWSEESDRVIKFQVGFCTLIKGHLEDYCQMHSADHEKVKAYSKSAESLTREIENLKDFACDGRFKADIQYACPVCTHVSTYSAHLLYSNNVDCHSFETLVNKCKFCRGISKLYSLYMNKYIKIEKKKEYKGVKDNYPAKNIDTEIQEDNTQTIHTSSDGNITANDKGDNIVIGPVARHFSGQLEKHCGEPIKTTGYVSKCDTQTVRAENVTELNDDFNCKSNVSIQTNIPKFVAKESLPEGIAKLNISSVNQNNITCSEGDNLVTTEENASNYFNGLSNRRDQRNVLDMSNIDNEYSNPSDSIKFVTSRSTSRNLHDESDVSEMLQENIKQSSSIEVTFIDAVNYRYDIIGEIKRDKVSEIEINNDRLNSTDKSSNTSVNLPEYGHASGINVSKSRSIALFELDGRISTVYRVAGDSSDTIINNTFKEDYHSIKSSEVKSNKRKINDCISRLHSKLIRNNVDVRNKSNLDSCSHAQNTPADLENGDKFDQTFLSKKHDEGEKSDDFNKNKTDTCVSRDMIDTNECPEASKAQNQESERIIHEINNSESRKTNNANEVDLLKTVRYLICNSETIDAHYDTKKAIHKESDGTHVTRDVLKIDGPNEGTNQCVNTNQRGSETENNKKEGLDFSKVENKTRNLETRGMEDQTIKTNNENQVQYSVESKIEIKTNGTDKEHNKVEDKSETNKESKHDKSEMIAKELGKTVDKSLIAENENNVNHENNTSDEETNMIIVKALENCFNTIKNNSNAIESTNVPSTVSNSLNLNSKSTKAFVKTVAIQDQRNTKIEIHYTCNICTCMFFYGVSLLQHLRKNHCIHLLKIPIQCITIKCSHCRKYLRANTYNLHVKRKHSDECFKNVESSKTEHIENTKVITKFKKAKYDKNVIAATKKGRRYKYKCLRCPAILNSVYSVRKHRENKHPDMKNRKLVDKVLVDEKGQQNSEESSESLSDEEQQNTGDESCSDKKKSSSDIESKSDMKYESDNNTEEAENCNENMRDEEQDTNNHDEDSSDDGHIDQEKINRTTTFEEDDVDNYSGDGSDTDRSTGGEIETNFMKGHVIRKCLIKTLKEFETLQKNRKHTYIYKCTICAAILKSVYAVGKHRRDNHPYMKNRKIVEKIPSVVKGLQYEKNELMDGEEKQGSNREDEYNQLKVSSNTNNNNDDRGYESNGINDLEENDRIKSSADESCEENYVNEPSDNEQDQRNRDESSSDEIYEDKINETHRGCDNEGKCERNVNEKRDYIRKLKSNFKGSQTSTVKMQYTCKYKCSACELTQTSAYAFRIHRKSVHPNMKNVKLVDKMLISEEGQKSSEEQPVKNNENEIHLNSSKIKSIQKCDYAVTKNGNSDGTGDENKSLKQRSTFEDNNIEPSENVNNQVKISEHLNVTIYKGDVMENREIENKQCAIEEENTISRAESEGKTGIDNQRCLKKLRDINVDQHYSTAKVDKAKKVPEAKNSTYECSLCKECFYNHYGMRQHREIKHPLMNNVKIYKKVKTNYDRQKELNKKVAGHGNITTCKLSCSRKDVINSTRIDSEAINASNDKVDKRNEYASHSEENVMFTSEEKVNHRYIDTDKMNQLNSKSVVCALLSGSNKLEMLRKRGGGESGIKVPSDEAYEDVEQDTAISSGADSNARFKQTTEPDKEYRKGEDDDKTGNHNEVHKNEKYSNCYTCGVNFDVNIEDHTCVPMKKIAILYNCYACGINLQRNVDHTCSAYEGEAANIKISNVVSLKDTRVYVCFECSYATDLYDHVVRHCQNHYIGIEDSWTYCSICQLNIDVNRFDAHCYLHERDIKKIKFSYTWLFNTLNAVLDGLPLDVAREVRAQSIYATHCVRMVVVVDAPWEYTLYQCVQCKACVPPEDIERHCTSECTYTNHLCSVCDRYFVSGEMRDNHETIHRNGIIEFRLIAFNSKEDAPLNLKLIKSNEIQGRETKMKASQIADIYKCQCGLCFVSREAFKTHFLECNFSIRGGILCQKCPVARLYLPSELNEHLNLHHGDVTSELVIHQINVSRSIEPCDMKCDDKRIECGPEPCSDLDVNDAINLKLRLLKPEDDSIVISDDDD